MQSLNFNKQKFKTYKYQDQALLEMTAFFIKLQSPFFAEAYRIICKL